MGRLSYQCGPQFLNEYDPVMAHTAAIGSLAEDLIKATIKATSKAQLERHKRSALREFGTSKAGRTNQFVVNARLEGLVEKAGILNNDQFANALHVRLAELSSRSKHWTPEILFLLLQLSDRPVQNTRVEDLLLLEPDSSPAPLMWADIVADDPYDQQEQGLWKLVDFSADASDEDESDRINVSDDSESTAASSVFPPSNIGANLDNLIIPRSTDRSLKANAARFWQQKGSSVNDMRQPKLQSTELHVIREVVFMLLGLPTSICTTDIQGKTQMKSELAIRQLSETALAGLLQRFTDIVDKLTTIRQWTSTETNVPLEQSFRAAVASRLVELDSTFHKLQLRILRPQLQVAPSLIQVFHEVNDNSRLALHIHEIVQYLGLRPRLELPFDILEQCFDRACVCQSLGDADGYEWMANIFFDCFQTYLRPIQDWMERGQLSRYDRIMFIKESDEDMPLASLWQKQYRLLQNDNAQLHAPKFLRLAAKKIFNTGKSVSFLKKLGCGMHPLGAPTRSKRPGLTFETVCRPADSRMLCPFSELFDEAFDGWITTQHHLASSALRTQLEEECGLQRSLEAIECIYFCRHSPVSSKILAKIFENIDRCDRRWNDNFIITEIFREGFSSSTCVDIDDLEVRSSVSTHRTGRSMSVLEDLRVNYTLSWPVANIINMGSMETYQHIFTFVAQIQRAKYLLQRHRLFRGASPSDREPCLLIQMLRHRLLWFINTILSYIMDIVLSANTLDMRANMTNAEDVDSMIVVHEQYISQLKDRCLLTQQHKPIRQAVILILDQTVLLSNIQAFYASRCSSEERRVFIGSRSRPIQGTGIERQNDAQHGSDDDDDDDGGDEVNDKPDAILRSSSEPPEMGKLRNMCDIFNELHGFVTASVQGVSKAHNIDCWEILADSLAAGLGR